MPSVDLFDVQVTLSLTSCSSSPTFSTHENPMTFNKSGTVTSYYYLLPVPHPHLYWRHCRQKSFHHFQSLSLSFSRGKKVIIQFDSYDYHNKRNDKCAYTRVRGKRWKRKVGHRWQTHKASRSLKGGESDRSASGKR